MKLKALPYILFISGWITSFAQGDGEIKVYQSDSSLTQDFIEEVCSAARNKTGSGDPNNASELEKLLNKAAGTEFKAPGQTNKLGAWWKEYAHQIHCRKEKGFPEGGLLRQIVFADFRSFANHIGPNGRLALDLELKDPVDSLTILEFVTKEREKIESEYPREEFQKNNTWKKLIFYYMLFTEYKVQKQVLEEESDQN